MEVSQGIRIKERGYRIPCSKSSQCTCERHPQRPQTWNANLSSCLPEHIVATHKLNQIFLPGYQPSLPGHAVPLAGCPEWSLLFKQTHRTLVAKNFGFYWSHLDGDLNIAWAAFGVKSEAFASKVIELQGRVKQFDWLATVRIQYITVCLQYST